LRRRVEPIVRHQARNAAVAAAGALAVHLVEAPIVTPLARRVDASGSGLLPRMQLPRAVETVAGLLLLDYTLYVWHVLVHRVPWLWRFHAVHHVDLDLDATTAIRFHFGELALSTPWRAAQVLLLGIRPETLQLWQRLTLASILFHHANVRLPPNVERALARYVVTPRLHGIHHSNDGDQMASNWSSGLTLWDRLHGTLRTDVPQEALTIGVEGVSDPTQVTLPRILAMPFASAHARDRGDAAVSR
jgi:sterol desaturase/sphingolipid hydroxylase (fatty acid hydroxylase superfamily)